MKDHRVLSGMRPTGQLHLGHYHGVLKNWARLQNEYDSYYFVADWHAFTTHYSEKIDLETNVSDMIVDWLATGLNPNTSTLFVQSKVPEHAELHLLLSMSTPLSWLERVPSFKDQQEKLKTKDLSTYGFLGYPLLQSADILIYKAGLVPVGEDQVAHVEFTREVARRFNYVYGRESDFEEKAEIAKSFGADEVILSQENDFSEIALALTDGQGVDVVFDAVGQATIDGSIASTKFLGIVVLFGDASGITPPVETRKLAANCIKLTRVGLMPFVPDQATIKRRCEDLLQLNRDGKLNPMIGSVRPLTEASKTLKELSERNTHGKLLLTP